MAMKQGGFKRNSKVSQEIPSSSLADIAFLLLIFFMVTTVFRTDSEQNIVWPEAEAAEKIDEKQKDILNIWVTRAGDLFINDRNYQMTEVSAVVGPLYMATEQRLVISIRGDREVPYQVIDELQKELVEGGVVRVVFATELEQRMQRQRR